VSYGVWGELKYLEDGVDETRRLQKLIEKMVLDKTDITKEKLKQVYTQKIDWYITASEALKLNVIDEII
jgi:ATP-dependent protease ClpP protease subunit